MNNIEMCIISGHQNIEECEYSVDLYERTIEDLIEQNSKNDIKPWVVDPEMQEIEKDNLKLPVELDL